MAGEAGFHIVIEGHIGGGDPVNGGAHSSFSHSKIRPCECWGVVQLVPIFSCGLVAHDGILGTEAEVRRELQ